MTQNSRVEWIDICKAVAIFAMVFCHVGLEMNDRCRALDEFIHLWHMPIFFILSGLVFNTGKYGGWSNFGKLTLSRVKMLLVPYLAFAVICGVYNYFMFFTTKGLTVGKILYGFVFNNKQITIYSYQWFLTALFFTEIVFAVFYNLSKGKPARLAGLSLAWLAIGHFLVHGLSWKLPFSFDETFYMVPLFAIGVLGRDFFMNMRPLKKWWAQIAALALFVILCIFPVGKLNVRQCVYNPFWMYFVGIAVTVIVIMFIREQEGWLTKLKVYPAVRWLGRNTLAILVLNGSVRKSIPLKWFDSPNPMLIFLVQLAATLVVLAIIYALAELIKKYCPKLLGKF